MTPLASVRQELQSLKRQILHGGGCPRVRRADSTIVESLPGGPARTGLRCVSVLRHLLILSAPTRTPAVARDDRDLCSCDHGACMVCVSLQSELKFIRAQFPVSQKVGTLGSGGQLVSGTVAKVVKSDGTLAHVGEPGELLVRGPQVALGYYRNEEAWVTSVLLFRVQC